MAKGIKPTNPEEEMAKGRIAFWLDPEDIEFIASQLAGLSDDASHEDAARVGRIRFRAHAALHKAGLKSDTIPTE